MQQHFELDCQLSEHVLIDYQMLMMNQFNLIKIQKKNGHQNGQTERIIHRHNNRELMSNSVIFIDAHPQYRTSGETI